MLLREALLDALAVVLPVDCAGCGAADRALCPACRAALVATPRHAALADGTPVVSALQYTGAVRGAILAFKEQGRTDVARALAGPLRSALQVELDGVPGRLTVCTVPSTRAAYRRRGYDPVALLARRAGLVPVSVLRHARARADQKALGQAERARNVVGSLVAARPLTGARFVVVDDILTTGATLGEAVRAVRAAGGEVPFAVTLAFTARILPLGADFRNK